MSYLSGFFTGPENRSRIERGPPVIVHDGRQSDRAAMRSTRTVPDELVGPVRQYVTKSVLREIAARIYGKSDEIEVQSLNSLARSIYDERRRQKRT